MAMPKYKTVAEYLKAQPPHTRKMLTEVRKLIRSAAPKAEEVISYGIPGYKMNGRTGVFFAGWKEHFSMYPITAGVKSALADALKPYPQSKGTVRFSYDEKLPSRLITQIVKVRAQEADALEAPKKGAKKSPPRKQPAKRR